MRRNFSIGASLAVAAALCVAQSARAGTANFNDIPAPPPPTMFTHFTNNFYDGGLRFQDNEFDVLQAGIDPQLTGQTSAVMETGSGGAVLEPLTISAYTGNPSHDGLSGVASAIDFNLWYLKLGLGYLSTGDSDTLTISGFAAGGCDPLTDSTCHASVSQSFTVTSALTLETLSGFTNLAWVQISQPLLSGGGRDPGWLALDDFVYSPYVVTGGDNPQTNPGPPAADPTTGVPEPSAWALMILGFGGVGALVRRRRRADLAAA